MLRGKYLYGPGFWKDREWVPATGGFRGGVYRYCGPGYFGAHWRGPCHYFNPGYGLYPAWMDETRSEDEASFLKEQAELIRAELQEIEKRLAQLSEDQSNEK